MKKIDLSDCTFIIPVRIDSGDRTRNITTVLCYLLKTFNTKVILKEVDSKPLVEEYVIEQIKEFLDEDEINNLIYLFEKSDDSEFHRMKIINEILDQVETDVVVNYDSDVLLKPEIYEKSVNLILNEKYDIIYPYGFGEYQKQIYANDELVSDFLNNDFDFSILETREKIYMSQFGHVQFIKTKSYIDAGMENENFISWSPEDKERYFRFNKLGYKIGRIDSAFVYHLEHYRGQNSWFNNPHIMKNNQLWEHIQNLSVEQLRNYYQSQDYLNKYKCYNHG
jgi:predicted cupin superfamily sugar epimerase